MHRRESSEGSIDFRDQRVKDQANGRARGGTSSDLLFLHRGTMFYTYNGGSVPNSGLCARARARERPDRLKWHSSSDLLGDSRSRLTGQFASFEDEGDSRGPPASTATDDGRQKQRIDDSASPKLIDIRLDLDFTGE